jgi:hypothetical protein
MKKWQVALCNRAETVRLASGWPSHLGWRPGRLRLAGSGVGGEGVLGGGLAMRRTHMGSWDMEVLTGRTSSTTRCGWPEGNGGGGRLPGVVVDSSRCGEVVLGGVVLGVWSTRPKRG